MKNPFRVKKKVIPTLTYFKVNQQVTRQSGLVEDVCEHGVGHPCTKFMQENPAFAEHGFYVHGCDGCCKLPCQHTLRDLPVVRK